MAAEEDGQARSFEESIDLVDRILNGDTGNPEPVLQDSNIDESAESKETDDTITLENVESEDDDTNDGIDENLDGEDDDTREDSETTDDDALLEDDADENVESNSDIDKENKDVDEDDSNTFSDVLLNLGIESEDKVIELHESWTASQKKLDRYSEKEDLFYLLEQEGVNDVMDLAVAIKAASGDMTAINKILQNNSIDAVDLIAGDDEIGEFKYDDSKISKSKEIASDEDKFVTATTIAAAEGVKEDFIEKVGSWDKGSFKDVISSQKNAKVIAREIKTGRFDKVVKKVNMLRNSDFSKKYSGKDDLDMYKIASDMIGEDPAVVKKEPVKEKQVNTPEKEVKNSDRIEKAIKASEQSAASSVAPTSTDSKANDNHKSLFASDEELFAYVDSL